MCIVNGFYPEVIGGAEFQAKVIATELQKQGHEIIYMSIGHDKDEVKEIDGMKVYMLKIPHKIFDKGSWYYFYSNKFVSILKKENVDLIYQRILNSFSPYLSSYSRKNKIPLSIHVADKYCLEFEGAISAKVKKILFNITKKNKPFFITQNQEQKELIESNGAKVSLIAPNILNLQYRRATAYSKPFKIYWIANERPVKQIDKFIALAKSMEDNTDLTFNIIGKVSNDSLAEIEKVSNLNYLGSMSNEEVNEHLKTAHLLVNTSKSEGFSNTYIQAWMTGTPVVSLSSNPNMLFDRYQMGICCEGKEEQLKTSILEILKSDARYQKYVAACEKICKEEFSFEKNKQLILNFLNKLMDERAE